MRAPSPRQLAPYAAAVPLAVLVVVTAVQAQAGLLPWGDHAVVQTEVAGAGGGHQLLGTYSRYEWHHPGPALFYLLFLPWKALGGETGSLNAAVALVNLAAVAGIVGVVARCGGRTAALWSALVTGLYLLALGADPLRDYWVPHAVVMPFALYVVLCAAVASGRAWFLPAGAFVGTALMQTNLSMAGTVAAIGGGALAVFALGQGWLRSRPRPSALRGARAAWRGWLPFALAPLIVLALWAPPIYEEATNSPGNMAQVRDFFGEQSSTHGAGDALTAVAAVATVLPRGTGDVGDDLSADALTAALFAAFALLLVAGAVVGWRRERRFPAALCIVALSGIAAELYAATQVRGPIHGYIVLWFSSLAIAGWTGIGLALGPPRPRRAVRVALPAAVAVVALAGVVAVARQKPIDQVDAYSNAEVAAVVDRVEDYLTKHGFERSQVFITQPDRWPTAAGLILALDRDSRPVAVTPEWHFMFGDRFEPTGREDAALVFTNTTRGPEGVTLTPQHERIAVAGDTTVYAAPFKQAPPGSGPDAPGQAPRVAPTPAGD